MDPITPALFSAITAAAKDKAVGAAVDLIIDAAKVAAQKLRGLMPDGNDAKLARALVDHVLAEMAAFPPERAIVVEPLATMGIAGIWAPRGKLSVQLLWINHADFPVQLRDVHIVGRVGGGDPEWDMTKGDEFPLGARSSKTRVLEAEPLAQMPTFERGGAQCELTVDALVTGPWDEGRAQRTRGLVRTSLWMPALGFEPATTVLTEVEDIDRVIKHYLSSLLHGDKLEVRYADFDHEHGLRPGASKERFAKVAMKAGHTVDPGKNLALVEIYYANSFAAQAERLAEDEDFWPGRRRY